MDRIEALEDEVSELSYRIAELEHAVSWLLQYDGDIPVGGTDPFDDNTTHES